MKMTVKSLRKIIRDVLGEQTKFPGGAHGGGRLSDKDKERLAYQGFLDVHDDEEIKEIENENTNQ